MTLYFLRCKIKSIKILFEVILGEKNMLSRWTHLLEKTTINKYAIAIIKPTANFNNIALFLDKEPHLTFNMNKTAYKAACSFLTDFMSTQRTVPCVPPCVLYSALNFCSYFHTIFQISLKFFSKIIFKHFINYLT